MDTVQATLIQLLSEETKMEDQRDHYQKNQLYQKKLGDTLPSSVSDAQCQVYITGTNILFKTNRLLVISSMITAKFAFPL